MTTTCESGQVDKYFTSSRILELAEQFGLDSDYKISKACNVKQPSVSYWRKKPAKISLQSAVCFCRSVGISVSEYLGEEHDQYDDDADMRAWNNLSDTQKAAVRSYRNYIVYLDNVGMGENITKLLSGYGNTTAPADALEKQEIIPQPAIQPIHERVIHIAEEVDKEAKKKTISVKDESGKEWAFTVGEFAAARELLDFIRKEERYFNKPFIKTAEAMEYYSMGEDQFRALAIEADSFYKFAKSTIVCRADFERYIKEHYKVKRAVGNLSYENTS